MSNLIENYLSEMEIQKTVQDENAKQWLLNVKAFTPKLKEFTQNIRIEVLSQKEDPLYDDELKIIQSSQKKSTALIRTVLIYANEKFVCFARVCISEAILEKQFKDFESLKNRPLGETLFFNSPNSYRDRFQYFSKNDAKNFLNALPTELSSDLHDYGRCSVFNNSNGEVLVTEFFSRYVPNIT